MSGKIIKVAVARSSAPSCDPGDWVVKIGQVQGGPDKGKYSIAVFAAEHVDEARSLMHEVLASCTTEALVALAGTDHWHREQLRPQMLKLREEHDDDCDTLACSLGCCHGSQLQHLRAITIADGLPLRLRSLLGTWLREKGRLGCVHCVRCESWWHRGDLPWIDLAPLRAGEPQAMSLEERFTIARFDTEDGLLETIFARVQP